MARRASQGEKTMQEVTARAVAEVHTKYEGVDEVLEILPSWTGSDLVLDVKLKTAGWLRMAYVPTDDFEVAGVRELA